MTRAFDHELDAVEDAMMALANAEFIPEEDDPRNLDPEDEPLNDMRSATQRVKETCDALLGAIEREVARRESIVGAMSDEGYERWEQACATKRAGAEA